MGDVRADQECVFSNVEASVTNWEMQRKITAEKWIKLVSVKSWDIGALEGKDAEGEISVTVN